MVVVIVAVFRDLCECKCDIKGIFNFGDSNTDTGGFYAAFPSERGPFGMTFFKKPTGRATDGRVIVDFLGKFSNFVSIMWCNRQLYMYNEVSLIN